MDLPQLREWCTKAQIKQLAVMHRASARFGLLTKFFDGVEEVSISKINNEPVRGAVVELHAGDTFVVPETSPGNYDPESAFQVLTLRETQFWQMAMEVTKIAIGELAVQGAGLRVAEPMGVAIIASIFRFQAAVLTPPPVVHEADVGVG